MAIRNDKLNNLKIAQVGLGYVGLPAACLFADAGFSVVGLDVDEERVKKINKGQNPIKGREPGMDALVKKVVKSGKFKAYTNPEVLSDRDVILVTVQTPVEDDHLPRYEHMKSALKTVAQNMKHGALIIIESTIAPTTMEKVIRPAIEHENGFDLNEDYMLANCPERVMPGRLIYNLTHYDRLVGAYSEKSGQLVKKLYEKVLGIKVDITDPLTAEIVKSGENTYRDVQIAFANEMALLCEAYGANVYKVRELINKCPYRAMHMPGAGVGGHCIPKDSWLLVSGARQEIETKLIPLARQINDFMPRHMFDLLKTAAIETEKPSDKLKVVVLGYAYDANSDDTRMTPTEPFIKLLQEAGIKYEIHDPYVAEYKISLDKALKGANAVVLMTAHDTYCNLKLTKLKKLLKSKTPILIDGRDVWDKEAAQKAGFIYKGVGNI